MLRKTYLSFSKPRQSVRLLNAQPDGYSGLTASIREVKSRACSIYCLVACWRSIVVVHGVRSVNCVYSDHGIGMYSKRTTCKTHQFSKLSSQ